MDADAGTFAVTVEEGNKAALTYRGEQGFTIEDGYNKVGEVEGKDFADLVGQQVRCRLGSPLRTGFLRRAE